MEIQLGTSLKRARSDRGLSLRAVAAQIGVSAALISQIELGHTQPSVSTLYALVDYFGISLDEVLGLTPAGSAMSAMARAPFIHQSSASRPSLEMGNGVRWELVATSPGSAAEAVLVTYEPNASSSSDGSLMTHPGREDAYVVAGELTLELDKGTVVIRAGDSFSFDSARPHRFSNAGSVAASGLWLKTSGHV